MSMFKHLWLRIFIYTIIIIFLSVGMGFYLHLPFMEKRMRAMALEITSELHQQLQLTSFESAAVVMKVFTQRKENYLWLEDPQGNIMAGKHIDGAPGQAWRQRYKHGGESNGMVIWMKDEPPVKYIIEAPLAIEGHPFTLYTAFSGPKGPPLENMLVQGLVTVAIPAMILALWMSRRVSRPLRRLQQELSRNKNFDHLRKVTVTGDDEIADVAKAINAQAERLQKYIAGMRQLMINVSHEVRSPLARMALAIAMVQDGFHAAADRRADGQGAKERAGDEQTGAEDRLRPAKRRGAAYVESGLSGAAHAEGNSPEEREARISLGFKHLTALQDELEHMDKLIGTILQANRLELQDGNSFTKLISFSKICENSALRYEKTFSQAGLSFTYDIAPGLFIVGDGTLLLQLLSNLLDNAAKYTLDPGGKVHLNLTQRRAYAFLTVENSYPPVDASSLEQIFEPFFRLEQDASPGVGLGLSLVRKVAALHNGEVMAVSTDMGICLCVQMPLAPEGEALAVVISPEALRQ